MREDGKKVEDLETAGSWHSASQLVLLSQLGLRRSCDRNPSLARDLGRNYQPNLTLSTSIQIRSNYRHRPTHIRL